MRYAGKMKVVVWLENPIRAFQLQAQQLAELRLSHPQHDFVAVPDRHAFLNELPSAQAALVWRFEAAWYELAPLLELVATPAAGRDWMQTDPSGRVPVRHGSFHGKIMAESLLAMLLFHSRRLDLCITDQRERRYQRDAFSTTRRLSGQHALIVGYGPLGRECARLLKAVGMRVTGVKRHPTADTGPADAVHAASTLPELLPQADHLIVTLPGDTGTDHLISDRELSLLPAHASLYNLGRGNAVDEAALLRALETGRLAHAFLDVFEHEPLPADSPLWAAKNLTLMPHASAISSEYLQLWFEELASTLRGAPP
jgi:D-2-hydroxyacid dehydrogenase (NADP+)